MTSIRESVPNTRTVKLRVEVAGREPQLRLGMYADVAVEDRSGAHEPALTVLSRLHERPDDARDQPNALRAGRNVLL